MENERESVIPTAYFGQVVPLSVSTWKVQRKNYWSFHKNNCRKLADLYFRV